MKRLKNNILNRSLVNLYVSLMIFSFARGLIAVFTPIYLLNLNYSITDISIFYLIYAFSKLLLDIPTFKIVARQSVRYGFSVAYMSAILALWCLFSLERVSLFFVVSPVLFALSDGFIWVTSHFHISSLVEKHHKTRQVGLAIASQKTAAALAPLVGGSLASATSLSITIAIAACIAILALAPLRQSRIGKTEPQVFSFRWLPIMTDLWASASYQFHTSIEFFIWPLFIYLFIQDYRSIGFIVTVALLSSLLLIRLASVRGDKGHLKRVLKESSVIHSIIHALRPFSRSFWPLTAITSASDLTQSYQNTAWVTIYYDNASKGPTMNYISNMEVAGDIARIAFWSLMYLLSLAFDMEHVLISLFITAAVVSYGVNLIAHRNSLH